MPPRVDNEIGNAQLHVSGKQRSYLTVALPEAWDKQETTWKCHTTFTWEKINVIKRTFHKTESVSPVPECVDSSLKCMLLSQPFKTFKTFLSSPLPFHPLPYLLLLSPPLPLSWQNENYRIIGHL